MASIYSVLKKLGKSNPAEARAPEMIVCWYAASIPELQAAARSVAKKISATMPKNSSSLLIKGLRGRINSLRLTDSDAEVQPPTLTQWTAIPSEKGVTPVSYRQSEWRLSDQGILDYIPRELTSKEMFQSPLEGTFEIHADIVTPKARAAFLTYGMHGSLPDPRGRPIRNKSVFRSPKNDYNQGEIPNWGELVHLKMEIEDSTITTSINGKEVHVEVIEGQPEPWVMIDPVAQSGNASIRNLRIVGDPKIPDSINLSKTDMAAWHTLKYGEKFSADKKDRNATWIKDGDELLGRIVIPSDEPDSSGKLKSLLTYQRPFLEDGEFEFESYYKSGEQECHPTVGSSTFLVRPNGIWLREALGNAGEQDSSSNGSSDGEKISDSKPVPLKDDAWNKFVIRMTGDQLTMIVNDEPVLEYKINDPVERRQFGFFRYADKFESRVRRIKYQGQWPKQLPPVDSQELAYPSGGVLDVGDRSVAQTLTLDLARPEAELKQDGLEILGPAGLTSVTNNTMLMKVENAEAIEGWPQVSYDKQIKGDFDATIDFKDLSLSGVEKGFGVGFDLDCILNDPEETNIAIGIQGDKEGEQFTKAMLSYLLPDDKRTTVKLKSKQSPTSGRLRLSRRGQQIHCLFAPEDKEFELIESYIVAKDSVKRLRIIAKCSDKDATMEVKLGQLVVVVYE